MRQNTFHKRKLGLIKKAIELTVLTDCDCAIILRSGTTSPPPPRFAPICSLVSHAGSGGAARPIPPPPPHSREFARRAPNARVRPLGLW